MEVRNCRKCGKIFNYVSGRPICPQCIQKSEEDFQKVKQYLSENKGTSMAAVAEACEVDMAQIKQWLREERLTFDTPEGSGLTCENCGKPIISGRFCEDCKKQVAKGFESSIQKAAAPVPDKKSSQGSGSKMHFLRN